MNIQEIVNANRGTLLINLKTNVFSATCIMENVFKNAL